MKIVHQLLMLKRRTILFCQELFFFFERSKYTAGSLCRCSSSAVCEASVGRSMLSAACGQSMRVSAEGVSPSEPEGRF